jgi:hypothetical protein
VLSPSMLGSMVVVVKDGVLAPLKAHDAGEKPLQQLV